MSKTRTVCLPPGELIPGMQLATAIHGPQGQVLLTAGTVLDESTIDHIRRRGIEHVTLAIEDTRSDAVIAAEHEAAAKRIDYIFRGDGSPARAALREAVLSFRKQ